jgi:predicted PurR-regulated permease PerM
MAFCILLALGFYVTYYLLDVLLIAVILSYLVRPAKEKITFKNETVSTLVAEIIVLVPLSLFLIFAFISLVNALVAQQALKDVLMSLQTIQDTLMGFIERILLFLGIGETQIAEESLQVLTERVGSFTQSITESIVDGVFRLPSWIARIFFAAFLSFYLVRDGRGIKEALVKIAPEKNKKKVEKLLSACDAVVYGVVVGYLFKAIITGFLSFIVFSILGIGNPVVMAVVVAVFDFIPLIGPWTVFLGLFLWYALQGEIVYAIQVTAICYVSVSVVPELYIRPKIAGTISHVHPMVMLVGIIGGIMSLGPIGVLAGPLILGVIVVTVKSYFLDMHIERDDIIEKVLLTVRKRISTLTGAKGKGTTEKEPAEHGDGDVRNE